MVEIFPNLKKETDIQVQETRRVPNKMSSRKFKLGYIIIKMAKVKGKERIQRKTESSIKTPS